MSRALSLLLLAAVILAVTAGVSSSWDAGNGGATSTPPVACTADAKICPDGTGVGRVGPNCEFAPCPAPGSRGDECDGPADRSCGPGYRCIQRCGPPVAREDDPPPGYYCELDEVAREPRNCPICLAASTRIATPDGEVNVRDIAVGDVVWSADAAGNRVAATVQKVSATKVPPTHQVVHLSLADGREVWVSPGHPTIIGATVGELAVGDGYDGSTVLSATLVPYADGFTYDLLPDTATGAYWANGILLGSTLGPR